MQDVQIIWNNQQLDYFNKENNLPLSFNKKIDFWLDFFGNSGTTGADFSDTLDIPATKKNSLALFGSDDPLSYNLFATVQSADFIINVGYFMLFKGKAELVNVSYQNTIPLSFTLRVQGAAADIWGLLEGKSMNNIDMGIAQTRDIDILASRTQVDETANPIIWPLVNYGGRMVTPNEMVTTNWNYDNGVRPAIRIWWAIRSIFAQYGYTVIGSLYNSEMFRNLVDVYTNGDNWIRADNWVDFNCNVAVDAATATVNDGEIIVYLNDSTPPRNDFQGINSGFFAPYNSLAMLAMGGAWFEFEFFFSKSTPDDVIYQIELNNPLTTSPLIIAQVQSNTAEGQSIYRTEPIWFSAAIRSKRWIMQVRVLNQTNPGGAITFNTTTYYVARMTNRFNFGGVLQLSSCFQDKPVKDFLAGVAQLFGVVYYIDNVMRTVTLEARFVRNLGDTIPSHVSNPTTTYYKVGENCTELVTDQNSLSVSGNKPFGDNLEIFMQRGGDDAIYELYLEQLGTAYNNDTIPIYSQSMELGFTNQQKKTFENTFYSPTINSKFKFTDDNPYGNNLYYPTIIDNKDLIKIGNLDYENGIIATYKSAPRIMLYYGIFDFLGVGANTSRWTYERYDSNTLVSEWRVPTCFQVFPDNADYASLLTAEPFNLCYPTYFYSSIGNKVSGLIERYYSKYLAMVLQDKVVSVRARMPLQDYNTEDFRKPRWLIIGGQKVKCWIIEVANYNPLESEFADFTLVQDTDLIQNLTQYGVTSNQQRPVLLMRNDVIVVEDGTI